MARKDKCTGPDRSLQLQAGIVVIMIIRGLLYPDGGGVFLCITSFREEKRLFCGDLFEMI